MPSRAHFVHVPVDGVEICNGPGPMLWADIMAAAHLNLRDGTYSRATTVEFTLKTSASAKRFVRELKITDTNNELPRFAQRSCETKFHAIFCGNIVAGTYDSVKRSGRFDFE